MNKGNDKTVLQFKMIMKSGISRQVYLSMTLDSHTKKLLTALAKKNKISADLQCRWILMKKYKNWDDFAIAANENFRSMNMEAAKIVTDYFSDGLDTSK